MRPILSFLLLAACSIQSYAQPANDLDSSFSNDGYVTTTGISGANGVNTIAQPDGKMLVCGTTYGLSADHWWVARYKADGSPDSAFATNGILTPDPSFGSLAPQASMLLLPDGNLLVASGGSAGAVRYLSVIRYQPDGSPDVSFGSATGQAQVFASSVTNSMFQVYDGLVQADGKIVLCGTKDWDCFPMLARLNEDGTPDMTFNASGLVVLPYSNALNSYRANAVGLQADGKIVMSYHDLADGALTRYNADGTLDAAFGTNGTISSHPFFWPYMVVNDLAIQQDGKIVTATSAICNNCPLPYQKPLFAICRYNMDGSADSSFSQNGIDTVSLPYEYGYATSVMVQADGKIAAGGYAVNSNLPDWSAFPIETGAYAVVRYLDDGRRDSTFSNDGIAVSSQLDLPVTSALAQQPDGKYVVTGQAVNANNEWENLTARFKPAGGGVTSVAAIEAGGATESPISFYPNPAGQTGVLSYNLDKEAVVQVALFDMQGKKVADIVQAGTQAKGRHETRVALPVALSAGIYFLNVSIGERRELIRIVK